MQDRLAAGLAGKTVIDVTNPIGGAPGNGMLPYFTNANESLMALVDGKWVNMRVPYPLGFYAKWMDGRIDDPNAGWKGRGLWTTNGNSTPFHMETGKGTLPKVVKFQVRPDPLAH